MNVSPPAASLAALALATAAGRPGDNHLRDDLAMVSDALAGPTVFPSSSSIRAPGSTLTAARITTVCCGARPFLP